MLSQTEAATFQELLARDAEFARLLRDMTVQDVLIARASRSLAHAPQRRLQFRWWQPLAAAAALVLALYGVNVWQAERGVRGRVTGVEGEVARIQVSGFRFQANNSGTQLRVGESIGIGDAIRAGTDGYVKLAFADGSEIELLKNTKIALDVDKKSWLFGLIKTHHGKWIKLDEGRLIAQVAKQKFGRAMILTTPQARVTVAGTRFTLSAKEEAQTTKETRLDVTEGLVKMSTASGTKPVEVAAGHLATVGTDSQPIVKLSRVTDGLLALYLFDEGKGKVIHDVSGIGKPADMVIGDTNQVAWVADGLQVKGAARIVLSGLSDKFDSAFQANHALTVEMWRKDDAVSSEKQSAFCVQLKIGNHYWGVDPKGPRVCQTAVEYAAITNTTLYSYCQDGKICHRNYFSKPISSLLNNGHLMPELLPLIPGRKGPDENAMIPFKGQCYLLAVYGKTLSEEEIRRNFDAGLPK